MIILGVDPGIARTGWCVLKVEDATPPSIGQVRNSPVICDIGCVETGNTSSNDISRRLVELGESLADIIKRWAPSEMAIEELFFLKKSPSAFAVAEARGVLLFVAASAGVQVFEYNPRSVKIALTGSGSADKSQMQKMVQRLLNLTRIPSPDDAADAAAIALCHYYTSIRRIKK